MPFELYHYHPCYHLYAGIYNYIPDTNQVSSVYSVAAVLYLQFMLHVMLLATLCSYVSTSRCTVCVQCPVWLLSAVPSFRALPVLSQLLWDASSRPYYYRYPFRFYPPHALHFCCDVFIFQNLLVFSLDHISVYWNYNIYRHAGSRSVMMSGLLLGMVLLVP